MDQATGLGARARAANGGIQPNLARDLLVRYFDAVLNGKRLGEIDAIFAVDVVYHSAGSPDIRGRSDLKAWIAAYLSAVPDYEARIDDTIAEGDRAMLRWSCKGTQRGTLLGLAASGKPFAMTGMTVFRVRADQVVEGWIERDSLGLFRQLTTPEAPGKPSAIS